MKWFKEKEFACKCCGQLPLSTGSGQAPRENVKALVSEVLDPVREKLGKPIVVNSGYRCEKHNKDVGGVRNSQHLRGEAADVTCANLPRLKALIIENGKFDQLITYPTFLHVIYKRIGQNRHQRLKKGGAGYELD